jgi:hypothetical protein
MASLKVGSPLAYQAAVLGSELPWLHISGPQRDEGEQSEQGRGGAGDGEIRPLALGLDAEMFAGLLEGGRHGPAVDIPSEDVLRLGVKVGAQEGLRLAGAGGVAHQNPSDWQRRYSAVIPDCGSAGEFEAAALAAIPFRHDDPGPDRGRVGENLGELG